MQDASLPVRCPQCETELTSVRESLPPSQELYYCTFCQFPVFLLSGKYRFEKILGEGAFGRVYLMRHVLLQRDAERAAKLIKSDGPEHINMRSRFFREVQSTATVSQRNEHIVRIYDDFGEIPELGLLYYVMEYLEGKPLSRVFHRKEQLLPLRTCLHIFLQICKGMEAAHKEGIIHRDLKPENIVLIHRNQDPHFVKIVDFGISRPLEQADDAVKLTQGVLGTPLYMAPEQCTQKGIDARTDIYALGSILFELLVGYPPFYPKDKQVTSFELVTAQVIQQPPSPRSLRPDREIPAALEAVILQSLEKNPEDRFQSMAEFAAAVVSACPSLVRVPGMTQPFMGEQTPVVVVSSSLPAGLPDSVPAQGQKRQPAKTEVYQYPEDSAEASQPRPFLPSEELTGVGGSLGQAVADIQPKGRRFILFFLLLFPLGGIGWYVFTQFFTAPPDPSHAANLQKHTTGRSSILTEQPTLRMEPSFRPEPPGLDAGSIAERSKASAAHQEPEIDRPAPRRRRVRRRVRKRSRYRRRVVRRVKQRQAVAQHRVTPRPRPKAEFPHPTGCPKTPGLRWVRLSIRPRGMAVKLIVLKGIGRKKYVGGGKICLSFPENQPQRVRVQALHYRPCTVTVAPGPIYRSWKLQRTNPDEPEGGLDDYCTK